MEKTRFGISLKNIPNTNRRDYFIKLIHKTEDLIRRMRWKAYFFLHKYNLSKDAEGYGFKSKKSAQFIERLFGFENDLLDIVNNISFHKRKDYVKRHFDRVVKDIN